MPRKIQRYGWKPSLPDFRDYQANVAGLSVADEVDPRASKAMPLIFDQGDLGSCTANAVSAALAYDYRLDHPTGRQGRPSRLLIYYMERQIEGILGQGDTGAFGRDGFKAAQSYGWVWEDYYPYVVSNYAEKPAQSVWSAAQKHKLTKSYVAVPQDEEAVRLVLSNQQTIAFGFTVYDSFESDEVAETGVMPVPDRWESVLGGHEVLAIGYLKDYPDHVLCRNSWGTGWGILGHFLMPWSVFLNPSIASDHRTIVRPIS